MSDSVPAVAANGSRADTLALVLAGGNGTRLHGLTQSRAKPAVPFGGHYRTIDFTLSNCVNSGIRRIALLTQYKPRSLIRHVRDGWSFLRRERGELLEIWAAGQRARNGWYAGTADAVYQNRDLIASMAPEYVLVLAGDHVYSMDYIRMLDDHIASRADLTIACVEGPLAEAHAYGIVELDADRRVRAFVEKPANPKPIRGRPNRVYASMGIYLFDRDYLLHCLETDARDPRSSHDFGHSILPRVIHEGCVFAHVFCDPLSGAPGYWRDVGTIDSYWSAHMDLLREPAGFDPFGEDWPIWTYESRGRPARVASTGSVTTSILGRGCEVAGRLADSVLSAGCSIGDGSEVGESVLLPNVRVGRSCRLERVIVDSGCIVPDDTVVSPAELPFDSSFHVSPNGIVLIDAGALEAVRERQAARDGRRDAEVA